MLRAGHHTAVHYHETLHPWNERGGGVLGSLPPGVLDVAVCGLPQICKCRTAGLESQRECGSASPVLQPKGGLVPHTPLRAGTAATAAAAVAAAATAAAVPIGRCCQDHDLHPACPLQGGVGRQHDSKLAGNTAGV